MTRASSLPDAGAAGESRTAWILLAVLVAATASRWLLRGLDGLNLHYDEAQYYAWSLHPAWGYYSKPPLIAWVIAAACATCGDSEFCIRLPAALALAAAAGFVFAIARRLAGPRIALPAALLFALAPLVSFLSLFMTTDSLLLLAWAAGLYAFVRAVEAPRSRADVAGRGRLAWWSAVGLAAGVGLLAKYTMGIFALSALGYLAARPRRALLRSAGPWIAVVVAAACFAPNLAWNEAHRFATFAHTATISELDRAGLEPRRLVEFIGAQVAVFGPLAWFGVAFATRRARDTAAGAADGPVPDGPWAARDAGRLLLWFTLPFLAVISAQALVARANANWAAPTYVAASILAAVGLLPRRTWFAAAIVVDVALAIVGLQYREVASAFGVEWRWRDPAAELQGWDRLGPQVAGLLKSAGSDGRPARLLTDDRSLLSWLTYYARPLAADALIWNVLRHVENHFDLLYDVEGAPDGPFVFVAARDRAPELRAAFDGVEPLGRLEFHGTRGPASNHVLFAYRLGRFKGYAPRH